MANLQRIFGADVGGYIRELERETDRLEDERDEAHAATQEMFDREWDSVGAEDETTTNYVRRWPWLTTLEEQAACDRRGRRSDDEDKEQP